MAVTAAAGLASSGAMTRAPILAALLAAAAPALAQSAAPPPVPFVPAQVATLRDAALKDDIAWDIVEGLTTEVGRASCRERV